MCVDHFHFCAGKVWLCFSVVYVTEVAASGATASAVSFSGYSCLTIPAPFFPTQWLCRWCVFMSLLLPRKLTRNLKTDLIIFLKSLQRQFFSYWGFYEPWVFNFKTYIYSPHFARRLILLGVTIHSPPDEEGWFEAWLVWSPNVEKVIFSFMTIRWFVFGDSS